MAEKLAPLSLPDIHSLVNPKDQSLLDIGKGAVARSAASIGSGITDIIPSMWDKAIGDEEAAKRQMAEHKAKMEQVEYEHPTAYRSYKEVHDIPSGAGWLTERIGEELPLVPTFMVPGGVGARVGRGLAGRALETELAERAAARGLTGEAATDYAEKLAGRGATEALTEQAMQKAGTRGLEAGVGTAAAGVNIPETYENIYEETGELRPGLAIAYGGAKSVLDTMFPAHILKQLSPAGRDMLAAKIAAEKSELLPISAKRAFLMEATKNMALEGTTEGAQDFIDTLAAHAAGSKEDIFSPKHIDSWINSALAGSVGSTLAAPGIAMQSIQQRDLRQAEIDKRAGHIEVTPEELPGVTPTVPTTPVDAQKQAFLDYETQERRPRALGTQMDMFPALKRHAETQEPQAPVAAEPFTGPGPDYTPPAPQFQSDMFNEPANLGETEQQDLFPAEKMAAELQSVRGERAPTIDDTYAGPPQGQLKTSPVLTSEALLGTGLKPQSLYYRNLVGKDLSTKEGLEDARKIITAVRANPLLSDSTKDGIEDLVNTHATQQPMFGPRGGVNKEAEGGRRGVSGIAPRGLRTSTEVPVQPTGEETTGGAGISEPLRLGAPKQPATQPTSGTEEQPSALTEGELTLPPIEGIGGAEAAPISPEATQTAEPAVIPIVPPEQRDLGEEKNKLRDRAKAAYMAGDLEPHQYMGIVDMLAKGQHEPVQQIVDLLDSNKEQANQPAISEEGRTKTKARGKANLDRLLQLIGSQMYSANLADVSIKEMVQNSFDAVKASLNKGLETEGKIDVSVDPSNRLIYIRDNGQGMTPKVIRDAFLTIAGSNKEGLEKGGASGGFGMAKAAFLLGNERIWVSTAKDGVRTTFEANGADIFSKDMDMYEEKVPKDEHGTTIVIKVPESVTVNGEERSVWFPHEASDVSFFDKPMLHPNIEVNFGRTYLYDEGEKPENLLNPKAQGVKELEGGLKPVALAKHFDMSKYSKHTTANFDWGTADIYLSKDRVQGKWASPKHNVLSSGIYQFDGRFKSGQGWDLLPYDIMIDVKPTVPADSPTYPFDLKREGWKPQIAEDIGALTKYLNDVVAGRSAEDTVETFKNIKSLPKVDADLSSTSNDIDISDFITKRPPAKSEGASKEAGRVAYVPPTIDISNGTVTGKDASGKDVTYVSKDDEKYKGSFKADKEAPKAKDFLLDMGIDDDLPIFHNNTNVDYTDTHPTSAVLFSELGSLMVDMRDKIADLYKDRWQFGDLKSGDPYFVGISIDKDYHGVNLVVPFKGAMLNPLAVKGTTLPSIVYGMYDTMKHEFAHIPVRRHDADFVSAYHDLGAELASDGFDLEMRSKLARVLKKHQNLFNEIRNEYEKSTTQNIARSLHESENDEGVASKRDDNGAPRGTSARATDQLQPVQQRRGSEGGRGIQGNAPSGTGSTKRAGTDTTGGATLTIAIPPTVNLASKGGPFQAARGLDKAIDSVPLLGPEQTSALSAAADTATDAVRGALLGSLPTNALADMAKDVFPAGMAEAYHKAIQDQDGYLHGLLKKAIEPVMNKFRTAMKKAPRQRDLCNEVVNESTKIQIDPTDPNALGNAKKFAMGYLEFNTDGTEKTYKEEYFDTDSQRKAAIKAYNQGKPTTERAFAARDPDPSNYEQAEDIVRKYNQLQDTWKDLYKAMRNVNSAMLSEFKESLCERIDEADNLDPTSRVVLKKNILTRLAEHGVIAPYFTLGRDGDYWLAAEVPNDNGAYEGFVTATPDSLSRSKLTADLRNRVYRHEVVKNTQSGMGKKEAHDAAIKTAMQRVREYSQLRDVNYRTMPAGSVINDILGIIERKKPAQAEGESDAAYRDKTKRFAEIEHDIMQMVINSLPETAFVKALQKRKNTAGHLDDAVSVFEKKTRGNARQIANLRYKPKIMGVLKAMGEHTNMLGRGQEEVRDPTTGEVTQKEVLPQDNRLQEQYLHEFSQHANVILHPTPKTISKIIKTAVFGGTLGFNVSSGLIELSNLPMIVFPFLSAEYGMGPTRKAMGIASKIIRGSGTSYTIASMGSEDASDVKKETIKSMWSLANYGPDSKMGKQYATLIDIASRSGQLNRSPLYENLLSSARTGPLDKFNAMSGWMLHTTGRYNREVTILAAYELELARLKKKGVTGKEAEERAANKAVNTTETTNGSVAASSAGRIAQSSIGSVVYMYKRFGATQLYMQARTLYNAYKNPPIQEQGESDADYKKRLQAHKSEAKMLKNRFWGLTAATAVMSGLQGLPMFGIASMLYNLFKDDDDEDFNMVARRAMGDLLYNGPVEYMTGLSTASRTGLSNLIVKEPRSSGEYSSFSQSLMDSIGGPFPSMIDRFQRGVSMIASGNVERGVENLVPVSVANAMKGVRYFTSGEAETLRGDTIYGNIDSGHAFAQILGFTPAEVAKRQEFNAKQKGLSKVEGAKDSNIKGRYYKAYREGDYDGMQEARDMLIEFGAKHPALGYTEGTVDGVLKKSVKLHEGHTKKMIMGKEYPKKHLPEVQEAIEDLDIDPDE